MVHNQMLYNQLVQVVNGEQHTFDPDLTETFGYDASLMSRWQMQLILDIYFNIFSKEKKASQ